MKTFTGIYRQSWVCYVVLSGLDLAFLATAGASFAADFAADDPVANALKGNWGQIRLDRLVSDRIA